MSTAQQSPNTWPHSPYKGLSYYGPDDIPLFAGREDDIVSCGQLLALDMTRILILHGSTGSGKSSFLRAGLIPFLEGQSAGFDFPKEHGSARALFIRCTDAPIVKLSLAVYDFASRNPLIKTPVGMKEVRTCSVVSEFRDSAAFAEAVGKRSRLLVEVLEGIAELLPRTIVIVVDQGEEVLTLTPGEEGNWPRNQFFSFVGEFSKSKFDLKLLIAIRTEYYGRFQDKIRKSALETMRVRDYLLGDLVQEEQLVQIIERPTLKHSVGQFGIPFDFYHFSFAPKVAQHITQDLRASTPAGGTLPVLQIVCGRLYESTRPSVAGETWTITLDDYFSLGGVERQIDEYLDSALEAFCLQEKIGKQHLRREKARWRYVLCDLAKMQVDGTVTTDLKTDTDLHQIAERAGCRVQFSRMMQFLASEEQRILRRLEILNLATQEPVQCFTLGHDAIGLILHRWKVSQQQMRSRSRRIAVQSLFASVASLMPSHLFPHPPSDRCRVYSRSV